MRSGPRDMVRQIVVILDRGKDSGVAVHAKVVDGDRVGEEALDRCEGEMSAGNTLYRTEVGEAVPSTMPKPERRMGTREIVSGVTVLVWNSKPRGVWSYGVVGVLVQSTVRLTETQEGKVDEQLDPMHSLVRWLAPRSPKSG